MLMLLILARSSRFSFAFQKRIRGVVRLVVYLVTCALVLGLFFGRGALADVGEAETSLGREMAALAPLLGETAQIEINGEHVMVSHAVTRATVGDVLDRFEAHCDAHASAFDELRAAVGHVARTDAERTAAKLVAIRHGNEREGTVLCFVAKDDARGFQAVAHAADVFAETSDLGAFGAIRYVYAVRENDGATSVMTVWTDDHLRLDRLAWDGAGDAPGSDSKLAPRAPGSRRTFSATLAGTGFGAFAYETSMTAPLVRSWYQGEMRARGFRETDAAHDGALGFARDGAEVCITIAERDGVRVVAIADIADGARGL